MNRVAIRAVAVWTLAAMCGAAGATNAPAPPSYLSPTLPAPTPIAPIQESFETGLGEWVRDSSVVSTEPFSPDIRRASGEAHGGQWCVAVSSNGLHDNAMLWMERKITVPPGDYVVKFSFWVWSTVRGDAGGWDVVGAIGTKDPEIESDLMRLGPTSMVTGWREYGMYKSVHVAEAQPLWLAFGLNAIFDVEEKHMFDDVVVEIEPQVCRADFDHSGMLGVKDIFAFLGEWFAGSAAADYNGVNGVNTQDIFDFLSAWFAGC